MDKVKVNIGDKNWSKTGLKSLLTNGVKFADNRFLKKTFASKTSTLTPLERAGVPKVDRNSPSPYQQIGTAIEPTSRREHIAIDSPLFGNLIDKGGQQSVFEDAANPDKVLKVFTGRKFTSIPEIRDFHKEWMKRNRLPIQEKINFQGFLQGKDRIYPVYNQNKVNIIGDVLPQEWTRVHLPKINKEMNRIGYTGNGTYTNGKLTVGDVNPFNVGYSNGNIRFIDADVYKKGGKLFFR